MSSTLALSTDSQPARALARRLEADVRDALDLGLDVAHRVEALVVAGRGLAPTARLAEIDVAGELAHDQDVEPGHDFGLQRRRGGKLRIEQRRAQVGEQRERLADAEDSLLGAQRRAAACRSCGPPTAPSRTASRCARERRAWLPAADAPRRRSPRRRWAPVSVSTGRPSLAQHVEHASPPRATISVPMPSPGRMAIFMCSSRDARRGARPAAPFALQSGEPGLVVQPPRLERADLVGVLQRESDVVPAVQQAVACGTGRRRSCTSGCRPRVTTDWRPGRWSACSRGSTATSVNSRSTSRSASTIGQQPVLEAVVEEDVGERRRDQRAEAVIGERPGRVLARAAAAEVLPREQDRGAPVARLVEHEIGIRAPRRRDPCQVRRGRCNARRRTGSDRSPTRLIDFRNCLGMIASVSTFARSSGATSPVWTRKGCMDVSGPVQCVDAPSPASLPLATRPRERERARVRGERWPITSAWPNRQPSRPPSRRL